MSLIEHIADMALAILIGAAISGVAVYGPSLLTR